MKSAGGKRYFSSWTGSGDRAGNVAGRNREMAPKHRERMANRDSLVRLSVGIEAAEDIIEDWGAAAVGLRLAGE